MLAVAERRQETGEAEAAADRLPRERLRIRPEGHRPDLHPHLPLRAGLEGLGLVCQRQVQGGQSGAYFTRLTSAPSFSDEIVTMSPILWVKPLPASPRSFDGTNMVPR